MGHEFPGLDLCRIQATDDLKSIVIKLSEGNPGGLTVMMSLIEKTQSIDSDAGLGPLAHILQLDSYGIYGSRIWMFYKDTCGCNLESMIAVLRAVQLGKLPESTMHHAIDNYGEGIDIKAIVDAVKKELPNFGEKI